MEERHLVFIFSMLAVILTLVVFYGLLTLGLEFQQAVILTVIFVFIATVFTFVAVFTAVAAFAFALAAATFALAAFTHFLIFIFVAVFIVVSFAVLVVSFARKFKMPVGLLLAVYLAEGGAIFGAIRLFTVIGWWSVLSGAAGLAVIGALWAAYGRKREVGVAPVEG